jgi:LysM repeat protein
VKKYIIFKGFYVYTLVLCIYREGRGMELIKENIEYEQLLGENLANTVVKNEFLIPDTHPDVAEILIVDAKPSITKKEVLQDKVYLDGEVAYNVLYLAREEDRMGLYNIHYTDKFATHVEVKGTEHKMACEAECYMEHMDCGTINERKVVLGGIVKLKAAVYRDCSFEVVKDVSGASNVEMLKTPATVDKIAGTVSGDLIVKSHMQIGMDKPQVGMLLKSNVNIHKKELKILEGKIEASAFAAVEILYRGKDSKDVVYLKDDVYVNKEMELEGADPSMNVMFDFTAGDMDIDVKEDDLGENRVIDVEAIITVTAKAAYKQEVDMIDDVYSTQAVLEMVRKNYDLNVMQGQNNVEAIVKENIELAAEAPKPNSILMSSGEVIVTDKKLVEDKVVVEGIVKVNVIYNSSDEEKNLGKASEEIPFSCSVDVPGSKIDMQCMAKAALENLEASIEANTIAVKAVISVYARVNYMVSKDFLVEVSQVEGEAPRKKASVTIYVVQIGDTLWKVAKKYYTTIEELIRVNSIENPDAIKTGQKIIIPGRATI